jgi:hypothetical protein
MRFDRPSSSIVLCMTDISITPIADLRGAYHVAHLIGDVLEPCLLGFTLCDHVCESTSQLLAKETGLDSDSLLPNDRLGKKWLSENESLSSPLQAFLHNQPRSSDTRAAHDPSFVLFISFGTWGCKRQLTLKLERMTIKPPFSGPNMFSAGTLTLSNVMYAVPAAVEYEVLICLVSTPSPRGTRNTVNPPSVYH